AARHDPHDARVLVAGEIVPAAQGHEHVAHPIALAPRMIEVDVDAKIVGIGTCHREGSPSLHSAHRQRIQDSGCSAMHNAQRLGPAIVWRGARLWIAGLWREGARTGATGADAALFAGQLPLSRHWATLRFSSSLAGGAAGGVAAV